MEVAPAFVTIAPSMKGFGSKLNAGISGDLDKSGKTAGKRFGSAFGATLKLGALGGAAAVTGFLKGSIGEAREAQKVGAQTTAVIKSTGSAAGLTAKQVGSLSTAISLKTGIDDEAIQSGANLLLTFKNIKNAAGSGNDIFSQTTSIMTDMGAAMGKEPKAAAIQLGKALNDPVKGVTALCRVGVTFTDQQKKTIKSLVESGNTMDAQKIILKELKTEFGGSAAAQATASDKAKVAFGNLQETVGTALLPVLDGVAKVFTNSIAPALTGFVTGVQSGTGVGGQLVTVVKTVGSVLGTTAGFLNQHRSILGALVGGLVAFKTAQIASNLVTTISMTVMKAVSFATKAWAAGQWLLNAALTANPIGLVIAAVVGLVAGLVIAYKNSETFRNIVNAAFTTVKNVVASVVGWFGKYVPKVFSVVVALVKGYVNIYKTVIVTAFNVVRAVVQAVGSAIGAVIRGVGSAFTSGVSAAGRFASSVKTKIGDAIGFVKDLPGKARDALGDLGTLLKDAGKKLIQGLIDGIQAKFQALKDKMGQVAGAVKDFFPGSPIRTGPLMGWNNGGAGKRLIDEGLIAGIGARRSAVASEMDSLTSSLSLSAGRLSARLSSNVTRPPAFAGSGVGSGSSHAVAGITNNIYDRSGDPVRTAHEVARIQAWGA